MANDDLGGLLGTFQATFDAEAENDAQADILYQNVLDQLVLISVGSARPMLAVPAVVDREEVAFKVDQCMSELDDELSDEAMEKVERAFVKHLGPLADPECE